MRPAFLGPDARGGRHGPDRTAASGVGSGQAGHERAARTALPRQGTARAGCVRQSGTPDAREPAPRREEPGVPASPPRGA